MAMAGVFSIVAGIYSSFPLMTGRTMHDGLAKSHFWMTLLGAYGTFLPMHLAGLARQPRHYAQLSSGFFSNLLPLEKGSTCAALFLASAQLIFLWNLFWSAASRLHSTPGGRRRWNGLAPFRASPIRQFGLFGGLTTTSSFR